MKMVLVVAVLVMVGGCCSYCPHRKADMEKVGVKDIGAGFIQETTTKTWIRTYNKGRGTATEYDIGL